MKKITLLSSLLLFSLSAYAKPFVQCPNNQCGLINDEGQWSIEPKYEYLFYNPDGLSKFMEKDQFGFVDANGKVIIRPQESNINRFTPNGLARFKKNNKWGVTDKKLDTIVPAIYDFMTDYADNGLAAVKQNGKWGFIDSKGRVVIALDYTYAAAFAPNGLAVVEKDGLYGYINADNKMVIKPQFKRADTFSQNGLALVQKDGKLGFIDAKGEIAIELQKTKMEPFTPNGLALIQKDGKYGFINATGKMVIPAVYAYAQSFMPNGLAVVQKDGKYGIIDSSGAFKIKPEFTKIENASDFDILGLKHETRGWEVYDITSGKIVATYKADDKGVKYEITNAKGEIIWPKNTKKEVIAKQPEKVVEKTPKPALETPIPPKKVDTAKDKLFVYCPDKCGIMSSLGYWVAEPAFETIFINSKNVGLILIKQNNKYGFIDTKGTLVIPAQFEDASGFSDGLARVKQNGKWGLIDTKGTLVIPAQFEDASYFSDGLVRVKQNGKHGFIDTKGTLITPAQFEDAYGFSDGFARVKQNGKYGFIDTKGTLVIPAQFEDAYGFSDGLACVKQNGIWGFIDTKGTLVIPAQFEDAYGFSDGLACVKQNGKWGFIGTKGTLVIPAQFEDTYNFSDGLARVKQNGKYGFIDTKGTLVIPAQFENTYSFSDGLVSVKQNGKWGFIDTKGTLVIPAQFENTYSFSDGLACVKQNGKWGFIDTKGKFILPAEFKIANLKSGNTSDIWELEHSTKGWAVYDVRLAKIVATYRKEGSCGTKNEVRNAEYETIWPKNRDQLCKEEAEKSNRKYELKQARIQKDLAGKYISSMKAQTIKYNNAYVCNTKEDLFKGLSAQETNDAYDKIMLNLLDCSYQSNRVTTKGHSVELTESSWGEIAKITDGEVTVYAKKSDITIESQTPQSKSSSQNTSSAGFGNVCTSISDVSLREYCRTGSCNHLGFNYSKYQGLCQYKQKLTVTRCSTSQCH